MRKKHNESEIRKLKLIEGEPPSRRSPDAKNNCIVRRQKNNESENDRLLLKTPRRLLKRRQLRRGGRSCKRKSSIHNGRPQTR